MVYGKEIEPGSFCFADGIFDNVPNRSESPVHFSAARDLDRADVLLITG